MVRVLICDDSMGFPALVRAWLDDDPRFEHVGTATNGAELRELAGRVEADAVVLDLVLPDVESPVTLVADVRERLPTAKILLVSSLAVAELERAAAAAGADGFCHKAVTSEALTDQLYGIATAA